MTPFSMRLPLLAAALALLAGCRPPAAPGWQGYLEGEFVHVAAPLAGRVERLAVSRGQDVAAGAPLFVLESAAEQAALREAEDRLRAAEARLADLRKGARTSELATLEARLGQGRSTAELSRRELVRQEELYARGTIAAGDLDRARLAHERNTRAIEEASAQLATARLGAREDLLAAAEAEVAAARAARARAAWAVDQKTVASPAAARVHDTLFREGEFAAAATPVVSLLPPANLKVRFFVPEADFGRLRPGQVVRLAGTGLPAGLEGRITYLSPRPEYTPPVLYNRDNRAKLVFLVEAALPSAQAAALHPGQPVDVVPAP